MTISTIDQAAWTIVAMTTDEYAVELSQVGTLNADDECSLLLAKNAFGEDWFNSMFAAMKHDRHGDVAKFSEAERASIHARVRHMPFARLRVAVHGDEPLPEDRI